MDAQKLKIYLVVENPETREAVNINGSFDLFKRFLESFTNTQPASEPATFTHPIESAPLMG